MITGLPPLVAPIEQSIRCVCGLRYIVFTGGCAFDDQASDAAQGRAEAMGAQFVDARIVPFILCGECGALLDFTQIESELVM